MNSNEHNSAVSTAAFLLVIPGILLAGVGVGMALGAVQAGAVIGLGAGLTVWGLIVALGWKGGTGSQQGGGHQR